MEKIIFLIIPVMFIYFLVQNDNYSPKKIKAFALTGRQACIHYYPGRCPGLGASALSGRVGQNLRKFSNLIIALQKLLLPRHFRH